MKVRGGVRGFGILMVVFNILGLLGLLVSPPPLRLEAGSAGLLYWPSWG